MKGSIRRSAVVVGAALMLLGAVQTASASANVSGLGEGQGPLGDRFVVEQDRTGVLPRRQARHRRGRGLVWDLQHHTRDVVLTGMYPVHPLSGPDSFVVTAHEDQGGTGDTWWAEAYAICVNPIAGMHTKVTGGTYGSASSQRPEAHCDPGERVLGSGGYVQDTGGQVGIQVARASTLGTFSYFQAHEDADGYAGNWGLLAVCGVRARAGRLRDRPDGLVDVALRGGEVGHRRLPRRQGDAWRRRSARVQRARQRDAHAHHPPATMTR